MRQHAIMALILVAFASLAGFYSITTPIFEAPDETAHVDFVRALRSERALPRIGQGGKPVT